MSGVNSALASLVTQADDDGPAPVQTQRPPKEPKQQQEQSAVVPEPETAPAPAKDSGRAGGWFRCFRSKDKKQQQSGRQAPLSAVVPAAAAQAPQKWEDKKTPAGSKSTAEQQQKVAPSQPKERKEPANKVSSDAAVKVEDKPEQGKADETKVTPCSAEEPSTEKSSSSSTPSSPSKKGHKRTPPPSIGDLPQLGPQVGSNIGRKTLVLDLDETLVHSSFRVVKNADIVIGVEIEGEHHQVYVRKRPGCDEFLVRVAELYEIVIYTASMAKYASPLLDKLDASGVCHWRLYREACTRFAAGYAKDLSKLGRDLKHVIIIDNSPICYSLQPDNAIPIQTWRDDVNDRELLDLIPILISLADVDDIPQVLRQIIWSGEDEENFQAE